MNAESVPELFPLGIYTIPEISTVGRNEQELTEAEIAYEVGKASYREIARGQILGDSTGLLKLLFHVETRPSVWVLDNDDLPRALEVARDYAVRTSKQGESAAARSDEGWVCPDCSEQVEAQFSDCWNCGTARPSGH